ncbi:MAG: hypothetical protein LBC35_03410 [Coriobacteriales bacterium]|nr:hypothetical protein [Coriobacteriales bacterium]
MSNSADIVAMTTVANEYFSLDNTNKAGILNCISLATEVFGVTKGATDLLEIIMKNQGSPDKNLIDYTGKIAQGLDDILQCIKVSEMLNVAFTAVSFIDMVQANVQLEQQKNLLSPTEYKRAALDANLKFVTFLADVAAFVPGLGPAYNLTINFIVDLTRQVATALAKHYAELTSTLDNLLARAGSWAASAEKTSQITYYLNELGILGAVEQKLRLSGLLRSGQTLRDLFYEQINSLPKDPGIASLFSDGSHAKDLFNQAGTAAPPPVIDPLVLDLSGAGISVVGIEDGTYFDFDGDGIAQRTAWISEGSGLLVYDRNDNEQIEDGSELFGDWTELESGVFAINGFAALAEFDTNADGVIDENDEAFSNLRVWIDSDHDGFSDAGELALAHFL